jgi:hypothetical protein
MPAQYGPQLEQIIKLLNRPSTPTWLIALFSAFIGAAFSLTSFRVSGGGCSFALPSFHPRWTLTGYYIQTAKCSLPRLSSISRYSW